MKKRNPPQSSAPAGHRERILRGFAQTVTAKGYASSTIADIAARASISKRTFYEHFRDRDECFLAYFSHASQAMIATLIAAMDPSAPVPVQLRGMIRAYLAGLQREPALTRAFFMETQSGSARLVRLRRQVLEQFSETLLEIADALKIPRTGPAGFSRLKALAIVGGINELVMMRVEVGKVASLDDLEDTAVELLCQILGARQARSRKPATR